jgi:hypothetical protein
MQTHYEEMTDKELRKLLKTWGWMLKKDGDQYEVYPKGERGSWSYFTTDKMDALGTAAAESRAMFNNNLRHITNDEVKGALLLWFSTFRSKWRERLFDAWYTGNYGSYNTQDVSSILQRLRNTNGHDTLTKIPVNLYK